MSTGTSQIQSQSLPATSAAASYHSMRVYHQLIQWKGEKQQVPVEEWGWRLNDDQLVPIIAYLQAAPEALLRIVRGNGLSDCSSMRCTCENMIKCSVACGHCRSTNCTNAAVLQLDFDEDVGEDEDD